MAAAVFLAWPIISIPNFRNQHFDHHIGACTFLLFSPSLHRIQLPLKNLRPQHLQSDLA